MSAYLSEELYKTITENMPIPCVDILPVRKAIDSWEIGLIVRATGSEKGKHAILGGRIRHSETINQAIARHLKTDLSVEHFEHLDGFSDAKPFMVYPYYMQDGATGEEHGFDPTKHSLGLVYPVEIDESLISPKNEASGIEWITEKITDPAETGFNQHIVVNKLLDYLNSI